MKIYFITLFSILGIIGCNIFEEEILFTDIEDPDVIKYQIIIPDSLNILEYSKYKNGELIETNRFVYDSIVTEKWTYDKNNKLVAKRIYNFPIEYYEKKIDSTILEDTIVVDTFTINKFSFTKRRNADHTIDSLFYGDSIIIISSEYSYSNDQLVEANRTEYTMNGTYRNETYSKYYYNSDKNIFKENYKNNDVICSNEIQYTDDVNIIDLDNFENELLGKYNANLPFTILWERYCNTEEHEVKPSSRYIYEFDANGFVLKRTEEYTPAYMEYVGAEVNRLIKHVEYEYSFNKEN